MTVWFGTALSLVSVSKLEIQQVQELVANLYMATHLRMNTINACASVGVVSLQWQMQASQILMTVSSLYVSY